MRGVLSSEGVVVSYLRDATFDGAPLSIILSEVASPNILLANTGNYVADQLQ